MDSMPAEMDDADDVGVEAVVMEYLRGLSQEARAKLAEQLLAPPEAAPAPVEGMGDEDMGELAAMLGEEEMAG